LKKTLNKAHHWEKIVTKSGWLAITSKGKGKSGGGRLISNIVVSEKSVYLLAIYDKAEQETLADNELSELLKKLP
jgi:hypothetical protein